MKFVLIIFILMSSAFADSVRSRIHSIDVSSRKGVPHLVKLENGRVVFVPYENKLDLFDFKKSMNDKETLLIELNEKNEQMSVSTVPDEVPSARSEFRSHMSYEPSVVTQDRASTIFYRMRTDTQYYSQCYNRAHVWAYEEYRASSLKSMKLFLFFTSRYIRNYRYKWWFHVTPMVYQKADQGTTMTVLDREFTRGPRTVSAWLKNFIYSGRSCPIVSRYSDYSRHQEEQDCYLIPATMYFWQPRDLDNYERTGSEKTSFVASEVNYAYWEAF